MTFKIEYSDEHFRLILVSVSGEEDYLEAVPYASVSSVVGPDGVVYGCYLSGSENELDILSNHPTNIEMVSQTIKVYDLTDWPTLKPVAGTVTLVETEFEDVEGEGDEDEEEGDTIDVVPIA